MTAHAYTENITTVSALVAARTDSCTTQTSTTVLDATAVAGDLGKAVSGPGIPLGTSITAVSAGTSWTISQAATASTSGVSLTVGQQVRAIANRTGFVRVYDPTLGAVNALPYSTAWLAAAYSYNLPQITSLITATQFDDAAPWYAQGGTPPTSGVWGAADSGSAQVGAIKVIMTVPAADVVNAASVQTFMVDPATLVIVATGFTT
jgi:hypothetical protein